MHIVDGGAHAQNMQTFAMAKLAKINNNVEDIVLHDVKCNSIDPNAKQMSSVEEKLKEISPKLKKGDFLALPGVASVSLLNLNDRIKNVLNKDIYLNTKNLQYYKTTLLEMLERMYKNQEKYSSDIE